MQVETSGRLLLWIPPTIIPAPPPPPPPLLAPEVLLDAELVEAAELLGLELELEVEVEGPVAGNAAAGLEEPSASARNRVREMSLVMVDGRVR